MRLFDMRLINSVIHERNVSFYLGKIKNICV